MSDWVEFTKKEIRILKDVAKYVDEIYVEDRKGISQTRYIIQVDVGEYTDWDSADCIDRAIPKKLIGTWMLASATDLRYESWPDCFEYQWVKCKQVEVTTTEWVKD